MRYRRMGNTGLQLSVLGLGAWITFGTQFGRSRARELVSMAFDAGVNFFDNAEIYAHGQAEQIMGDVFKDLRLPRDAIAVSSKVYFGSVADPRPLQRGLSRKHIRDGCDGSLRRLGLEYLDVFFCHRPDSEVDVEETVAAMDLLVRAGKILYWGTSEWPREKIEEAQRFARNNHLAAPVVEQPQYNLLNRERVELEYAPLFDRFNLALTVWSPLASGLLTGKYAESIPQQSRLAVPGYEWLQELVLGDSPGQTRERVQKFCQLACELDLPPAQMAIAWCLANPKVTTVILGASKPDQLRENLDVVANIESLDREALKKIESCFA